MKCPNCGNKDLYEHTGPKAGKFHCNECGTCAGTTETIVTDQDAPEGVTDVPLEVSKGGGDGVSEGDAAVPEDTPTPERRTRKK